jgi:hypothetical protein
LLLVAGGIDQRGEGTAELTREFTIEESIDLRSGNVNRVMRDASKWISLPPPDRSVEERCVIEARQTADY